MMCLVLIMMINFLKDIHRLRYGELRIIIKWSKCTNGYFSVGLTKVTCEKKKRLEMNQIDGADHESIIVAKSKIFKYYT